MHQYFVFALTVATGFFAIMNPVGNTPIFLGLVDGLDEPTRRKVAWRGVLIAFVVVTLFTVGGNLIFRLFGISLPAFRIAGGLLVFLVGYQLLHGRTSAIHHPGPEEGDDDGAATTIATTPLAIPILAGPGTISTALSFAGEHADRIYIAIVVLVFAIICLLTYIAFRSGERLTAVVRPSIIAVVTRLMGVIITVIAAQMVIEGVAGAVRQFHL